MVDARGRVMTQADTSEKYKNEIIDFSKAGKKKNATVYSYQLGTVGKSILWFCREEVFLRMY